MSLPLFFGFRLSLMHCSCIMYGVREECWQWIACFCGLMIVDVDRLWIACQWQHIYLRMKLSNVKWHKIPELLVHQVTHGSTFKDPLGLFDAMCIGTINSSPQVMYNYLAEEPKILSDYSRRGVSEPSTRLPKPCTSISQRSLRWCSFYDLWFMSSIKDRPDTKDKMSSDLIHLTW